MKFTMRGEPNRNQQRIQFRKEPFDFRCHRGEFLDHDADPETLLDQFPADYTAIGRKLEVILCDRKTECDQML